MMNLFDKVAHLWLCIEEKENVYPEEIKQLIIDWYAEIVQPSLIMFTDPINDFVIICFYLIYENRYARYEPNCWPEALTVIDHSNFMYSLISDKTKTHITSNEYDLSKTKMELNPYVIKKSYITEKKDAPSLTKNNVDVMSFENIDNIIEYRRRIRNDELPKIMTITLINYLYIKSTIRGLEYLVNGFAYK